MYFGGVRDLIEDWFQHYPESEQPALRGALRSDNEPFAAAFWELYLHEAYRRAGYLVEVHPAVANSTRRPDFRMTLDNEQFYVEATSVGRDATEISEENRLDDVHRVLHDLLIEDFSLVMSTFAVGPSPLPTGRLRKHLAAWVARLDPDHVSATASSSTGFDSLPRLHWQHEGWSLEFHAIPLDTRARGKPHSALGAAGPGEATMVDNHSGLRRVLAAKVSRYGQLDAPLVIAVQSNTTFPTYDHQVEQVLYGISATPVDPSARRRDRLIDDGFWIDARGWRNTHVPQIITASGLYPWTVPTTVPRLWSTLDDNAEARRQPDLFAPVDVQGLRADVEESIPPHLHFGLRIDWPGLASPDFDLS